MKPSLKGNASRGGWTLLQEIMYHRVRAPHRQDLVGSSLFIPLQAQQPAHCCSLKNCVEWAKRGFTTRALTPQRAG